MKLQIIQSFFDKITDSFMMINQSKSNTSISLILAFSLVLINSVLKQTLEVFSRGSLSWRGLRLGLGWGGEVSRVEAETLTCQTLQHSRAQHYKPFFPGTHSARTQVK